AFDHHDADRGVHDLLERLLRLGVGEHDCRHRGAVEATVGADDARAELLDHLREHGHARLLELARDRVGVDDHRAALGEHRCDRRLPGADASREADEQHPATLEPPPRAHAYPSAIAAPALDLYAAAPEERLLAARALSRRAAAKLQDRISGWPANSPA